MGSRISQILPLLIITVLCVAGVEGGYTVFEYFIFQKPGGEVVSSKTPTAKETEQQIHAKGKHDPHIIISRGLFGSAESKGAPQPPPVPDITEKAEKVDMGLVLVGTISGSAGIQRAIILDKKTNKQALHSLGGLVNGAQIKEISRGKVVVSVQGRDEVLDMSEAAKVRPAVKIAEEPQVKESQVPLVTELPEIPPAVDTEPVTEQNAGEVGPQNQGQEHSRKKACSSENQ